LLAAGRRSSSKDLQPRNRDDKLPSPLANAAHLSGYFLTQVPRQNKQIIRPRLEHGRRSEHRDVRSRQQATLLVRAAVNDVAHEFRANAAVIEQRIPLGGGAVARDRLAGPLLFDEERKHLGLSGNNRLRQTRGGYQPIETSRAFLFA